jgi:acyl carrier protein
MQPLRLAARPRFSLQTAENLPMTDESPATPPPSRAAVLEWVTNYIVAAAELRREDFSTAAHFETYGLDSAELVIMAGVMEEEFGIEVDPEKLFETPSVDGIVEGLVQAGTIRQD